MGRKVAIYARVSTIEQSTDDQVEKLRAWCASQGWRDPVVFADDGVSGIRDNRPQLDRLRELAHKGELEAVVVSKMDRLGRSLGMILRFWDEAEAAGIRVVVVDQAIDTSTAAGRLQRNMLAALAEFERELILERTKAGIARARSQRKKFGRPRTVPDSARVSILKLAGDGKKVPEISRMLKLNESTVRTIIRREGGSAQSPPSFSAPSGSTVDTSGLKVSTLNAR